MALLDLLTKEQLEKMISTMDLFNGKYLTTKLLSELYGMEESTLKNYLKKETGGPNGHPKMFGEDYIRSHGEGWSFGTITVIEPDEAIRFYLKFQGQFGRKFSNASTPNRFFIESQPIQDAGYTQPQTQNFGREVSESSSVPTEIKQNDTDSEKMFEQIRTMFEELKKSNTSTDNSVLVEELRKQLEKAEQQLENEKEEKKDMQERLYNEK